MHVWWPARYPPTASCCLGDSHSPQVHAAACTRHGPSLQVRNLPLAWPPVLHSTAQSRRNCIHTLLADFRCLPSLALGCAPMPAPDPVPFPQPNRDADPNHSYSRSTPLPLLLPVPAVDVNECVANATLCTGPSLVPPFCVNTPGSYECACNTGYRGFDPTTNTCAGKAQGGCAWHA